MTNWFELNESEKVRTYGIKMIEYNEVLRQMKTIVLMATLSFTFLNL